MPDIGIWFNFPCSSVFPDPARIDPSLSLLRRDLSLPGSPSRSWGCPQPTGQGEGLLSWGLLSCGTCQDWGDTAGCLRLSPGPFQVLRLLSSPRQSPRTGGWTASGRPGLAGFLSHGVPTGAQPGPAPGAGRITLLRIPVPACWFLLRAQSRRHPVLAQPLPHAGLSSGR